MGYKLRRLLRDALPPEIAGLQRAVALEIADDANDDTRLSFATLECLVRWTAAKDERVIRESLRRLGLAGWEFRRPIGKGKDGRVLYAVPGRRVTFCVPEFEGVPATTSKGESSLSLPPEGPTTTVPSVDKGQPPLAQGPTTVAEEPTRGASGPTTVGPFSSVPSVPSSLSASAEPQGAAAPVDEREIKPPRELTKAHRIIAATGLVTPQELLGCVRWLILHHNVRNQGFWYRVEQNGDAPALVAEWRAATRPAAAPPARCGTCHGAGSITDDNDVTRWCPSCKDRTPPSVTTHNRIPIDRPDAVALGGILGQLPKAVP